MLAITSMIEWTASLRMPRLPVSRPTTSLPSTRATPIKTETSATSTGLRPRAVIQRTLRACCICLLEHRCGRDELAFRAQRDHQVALFETQLSAWIGMKSPIAPAQRQDLRPRCIEQTGGVESLAEGCRALADEDLLDPDLRSPVVQRVQHVHKGRVHRQLSHPVTGHAVRRDDAVGAGQLEPPRRIGAPGPGDDEEAGVQRSGREGDVDRAFIRIDSRDQAARALDPGLLEDLLARGIALDMETVFVLQTLRGLWGLLDDRVAHLVLFELDGDLRSDAAVSTDDVVIAELVEPSSQLTLSPVEAEVVLCQRLGENAEPVEHRTHTDDDQGRREYPAGGGLGMNLRVTNRDDRDGRHVEGVEKVLSVDEGVPGDADGDHDCQQHARQAEAT